MNYIIDQLEQNKFVFKSLFVEMTEEEYRWRTAPEKWSLLEVLCHLLDEEILDFKTRVRSVLNDPTQPLPSFDPVGLVKEKNYSGQNFNQKLEEFIQEREKSIYWLRSLENPQWSNTYHHSTLGKITAKGFLSNWLAHDLLHIRQIIGIKFSFLQNKSGEDLTYAGNW